MKSFYTLSIGARFSIGGLPATKISPRLYKTFGGRIGIINNGLVSTGAVTTSIVTPQAPTGWLRTFGDNGVDPILGPPYPPVNYELHAVNNTQPRLWWTVPDLIASVSGTYDQGEWDELRFTFTNYSYPAWVTGDQGYIINSRVVHNGTRYYSLQQPNISKEPGIETSYWAEDETVFALYIVTNFDSANPAAMNITIRGVTGFDQGAGFLTFELDVNDHPAFYSMNYTGAAPGLVWILEAVNGNAAETGSPSWITGDTIVWSQLLTI